MAGAQCWDLGPALLDEVGQFRVGQLADATAVTDWLLEFERTPHFRRWRQRQCRFVAATAQQPEAVGVVTDYGGLGSNGPVAGGKGSNQTGTGAQRVSSVDLVKVLRYFKTFTKKI